MPPRDQLRLDLPPEPKPPFRLPTMAEIEQTEPNGYEVVSFFSGAGGSCLGFRQAGFRTLYASEFVPAAAETYRANNPGVPLDERDIRDVDPGEVLELVGKFRGEVDVLEGSPPCSSFSMAGRREADWGKAKKYSDTVQRTDDLFDEYVRMIEGILPKVFIAENVAGLTAGEAPLDYIQRITRQLGRIGYTVEGQILNAARFGVPQSRRRLILIGVRRELGRPSWPTPLPYTYSIRDALPRVVGATRPASADRFGKPREMSLDEPMDTVRTASGGDNTNFEIVAVQSLYGFDGHGFYSADEPAETIPQRPGGKKLIEVARLTGSEEVGDDVAPSLEHFAIGDEWDELEADGEGSERYFSLVRPDVDRPVPTLTQTGGNPGAASVVHPTEKRKFTIGELKILCGFPEDFILTGSYTKQWERLGRAVPPPMMAAVARAIRDDVLRERGGAG